MLFANLVKHPKLERLAVFNIKGLDDEKGKGSEVKALELLVQLFNKGAAGWSQARQSYEYLGYVFADLAKVCGLIPVSYPSFLVKMHGF